MTAAGAVDSPAPRPRRPAAMTTAAEIEAAFLNVPPADRGPLLDRLCAAHDELHPPPLTPEQIATVNERAERVARGEAELVSHEDVMRRLNATIEAARRRQEGEEGLADAA